MKTYIIPLLLVFSSLYINGQQNVGIGTTTPEFKLSLDNDGGILAKGTTPIGTGETLITNGAGIRMLWYPKKAAFRAGYVDGTQWNDVNIGDYSFASGYNSIASGSTSTAMGLLTTASGSSSTAMGSFTTASGGYSTAMGTHTTASGNYTTAMGRYVSTNAQAGSFVVGDQSTTTVMNSSAPNQFSARFAGGYRWFSDAATTDANGMFLTEGNVGIGINAPGANRLNLNIADAINPTGLFIQNNYTGTLSQYGIDVNVGGTGSGSKYGIISSVDGLAGDASNIYGNRISMTPNGTGSAYGISSVITGVGTGLRYGHYNQVTAAAANTSFVYGSNNLVTNNGSGATYGYYADVNKAAGQAGTLYGINVTADNDGTGNSYLLRGNSVGSTTGTEYGVYVTGEDNNYLSGYTQLGGSTAPAIKMKKLTGTMSHNSGQPVYIAHGLTSSKILSISALVQSSSNNGWYTPNSNSSNHRFGCREDGDGNISVYGDLTYDLYLQNQPIKILIVYEE